MAGDHRRDGAGIKRSVVDNHDLESVARVVEPAEGLQAVREIAGPVPGRDDDGDRRLETTVHGRRRDLQHSAATQTLAEQKDLLLR